MTDFQIILQIFNCNPKISPQINKISKIHLMNEPKQFTKARKTHTKPTSSVSSHVLGHLRQKTESRRVGRFIKSLVRPLHREEQLNETLVEVSRVTYWGL